MIDGVQTKPVTEDDLPMLLEWRNHPDVRQWMYHQDIITESEHRRWFERSRIDSRLHQYVVQMAGACIGYGQLRESANHPGVADWGFYLSPERPRGYGQALGQALLAEAFFTLNLHKVSAEVLAGNDASQRFHQRLGFTEEGRLLAHHRVGAVYHDIILYGLHNTAYRQRMQTMPKHPAE